MGSSSDRLSRDCRAKWLCTNLKPFARALSRQYAPLFATWQAVRKSAILCSVLSFGFVLNMALSW